MPPRRRALASTPAHASQNVFFVEASLIPSSDAAYVQNIQALRRCWQWAAFSQFFYTFAQLLQMPEVLLADVEDDLARGTSIYLPRIMLRLLVTMSLDRKLTIDNWQTAFRKQCMKRGGAYNPLGAEPVMPSRHSTLVLGETAEELTVKMEAGGTSSAASLNTLDAEQQRGFTKLSLPDVGEEHGLEKRLGEVEEEKVADVEEHQGEPQVKLESPSESKDWAQLTMKDRLEALHMLTEWQFDNPHRLRQQMKDDGDAGHWRLEPIGYDSKINAYWLIGTDRLWIQRALPKPPRAIKRKRAATVKAKTQASTSKIVEEDSDSEAAQIIPAKRTRTAKTKTSRTVSKAEESTSSGRGARAAKVKANKMLDAQAKELAEFQRQTALLSSPSRSAVRATRSSWATAKVGAQPSPSRLTALGTRTSARLRGPVKDSDDEWQQVPDEWLKDDAEKTPPYKGRSTRSKGKVRASPEGDEYAESAGGVVQREAGLGSDAISELTELSDDPKDEIAEDDEYDEQTTTKPPESAADTSTRPQANGRSKKARKEVTLEVDDQLKVPVEYTPAPEIPKDFVEWETICVTLPEWEAIGQRFANATHYLEKALHKVLSQNIVPDVVAELKASLESFSLLNAPCEVERKRKIEEAVVHRKRSSRIATKETEKEEARAVAMRKAEEDEKLARARRQEARAKKEEADRERRETAREQRRLEREARELKIATRNEPKEDPSAQSTPAPVVQSKGPSLNGVVIPTPFHTPRISTPSGVRSPDWILDCEICKKNGLNLDDGLPMVSCGSCGRWQHITCHDTADHNAGYPKRNWTTHQFLCYRCRAKQIQRLGNGRQQHSSAQYPSIDGWTQSLSQKAVPQSSHAFPQPATDMGYSQQPVYDNHMGYGGSHYPAHSSTAVMYSRTQQQHPQGAMAFSSYQPEQRGHSGHASNPPAGWSNGYSSTSGGQRFTDQGAYSGARATPAFVAVSCLSCLPKSPL
ncbi:hypothetical protein BC835DRAFT_1296068 [Cytidiella melzeri]|nr:hypothetical protein BC835DRAFT_1296068 [Cytidiella melzeri]